MIRRLGAVLAFGLTIGCGGSNRNTLAPSASRSTSVPNSPGTPSSFGQFGVTEDDGAADFGRCLSGAAEPQCFSGAPIGLAQPASVSAATAVGAPTNLIATGVSGSITLTWSAPADGVTIASYIIEAGSAAGISDLARFATGTPTTTFSATGVPSGNYYIRVRGSNSAGVAGLPSNEVLVQVGTIRCVVTSPPSGLTLVFNNGGTVVLTWGQPSGTVASYVVEAGSASGLSNLANTDLGSRMLSLTAIGVAPGTYYVRMRARNACSMSPPSNEISFIVAP